MIKNSIDNIDITIFEKTPSQTSKIDRRCLLAIQRHIRNNRDYYNYVEIGFHLGGSIQPHLLDNKCQHILSIDPRHFKQADDRCAGSYYDYQGNSTDRMLNLLGQVCHDQLYKIETIEEGSSNIDIDHISNNYDLIFIDGEHTRDAVKKEFDFSLKLIKDKGVIILHDFWTIKDAIVDIEKSLRKSGKEHIGVYLGG